ncbi:MAG: choline-sulfatase [Acidobacteria bacterium]|nr:choline-sulfatase [Acidobacteriota bacterium]
MPRRIVSALAIIATLCLTAGSQSPPPSRSKPNILFIAVDDLNDWIGPLRGHPQAQTPNFDRLARRGLVFTNAHTQAPLCNPSRTSLLSGLRPSTTGLYALQPGVRAVPRLRDHVMLPQYLAAQGYQTFSTGKIYHDGSIRPAERAREFSEWGTNGPMPYPPAKLVNTPDSIKAMDWGVFPDSEAKDTIQADWLIADAAIDYLRRAPVDHPFFLAAGFRLPHVPCFVSPRWFELYPESTLKMPPVLETDRDDIPDFAWYLHWKLPEPRLSWLRSSEQWRPLVRAYLASISFMDSQLGRVLDALDASPHAASTIIVLWSDHGWHLGEKGITGKNTLWERSTRVPLIFAGPGIARGATSAQPVELLDLYPTLAQLSGGEPPPDLEGHSLVPLLRNPRASRPWPAITTHNQGNHSVRSRRWRYIRYANGQEELYDLRQDPHEWRNLARDRDSKRYRDVIRDHARWLPKTDAPPVAGSAARLLVNKDGQWYWEGKLVRPNELER